MNAPQTPRDGRLNILLLCADDHRADAFGSLGPPCLRTPHLDALMREGSSFTRAYTTVPICTPARAELLTGCSAFRNGVRWFGEPIERGLKLLPQVLGEAGYATFFTGKWHNDAGPGSRGYQTTRRVFNGGMASHYMRFEEEGGAVSGFSSELFAEAAVEFIQGASEGGEAPWFAHVAFTSPHDPRTPPAEWRPDPSEVPLPPNFMPVHPFDNGEMTIRDELLEAWPRTPRSIQEHLADYYGMLAHQDAQIGRILQALEESGQAEHTLVIYTGDHGLAIGSHGLMGKENMYEHSVRVPLVLRGPGIPQNRSFDALCHAYDLYATICGLAQVQVPEEIDSRSLEKVLCGLDFNHREAVFCAYRDVQRAAITRRWKLIEYPQIGKRQLFDLESDPHELIDLLQPWHYEKTQYFSPRHSRGEAQAAERELEGLLRKWQSQVNDSLLESAPRGNN